MKRTLLISMLLLFFVAAKSQETQLIKPDDNAISIKGAFFLEKGGDKVVINRISPDILKNKETFMRPSNVYTQSGVRISIYTDSKNINFLFEKREGASFRHSSVGIYKNGELFKKVNLVPDKELPLFKISNPDGKKWTEWTLVLPPYYGLNFKGVEIDKDAGLKKLKEEKKPVYVAIGNSITHGTGQKAGYETYSYQVADAKGWDLYNVAVGGSKISWPVAKMLKDKHIDVVTILWGYNDWNAGFTPDGEIIPGYSKLLKLLAKDHPDAKIYCILPTATKTKKPKRGNLTLDDIRNAEKKAVELVKAEGYPNISVINGEELSDVSMLNDKVHFTIDGAAKFADNLLKHLN